MVWLFCRRCAGLFRSPVIVALCPTAKRAAARPERGATRGAKNAGPYIG